MTNSYSKIDVLIFHKEISRIVGKFLDEFEKIIFLTSSFYSIISFIGLVDVTSERFNREANRIN